ncbi:hypothetical protein DFH07DRAFT_820181 [Mycena maculata]|uniref:Uncharacterized protein n=1 Tax=Mycena maculata TaxID=230809 RepID=A0AAD7J8L4_9AGAR|nr:hypothetical protein DFH07DRAFT_820181 [Mycena maculata]
MFAKSLFATVLCLGHIFQAHADLSPALKHNDLHCPEGYDITFVHNAYTYNAPFHAFTNLTSSFFEIVWTGGVPATSTTGTDNVPGATRSGPWFGGVFNETLTMYHLDDELYIWTYHGATFTYAPGGQPPVTMQAYAETTRFESICSGTATYIDIHTYLCNDNPEVVYSLLYTLHMVTFQTLAQNANATVMGGDCLRA